MCIRCRKHPKGEQSRGRKDVGRRLDARVAESDADCRPASTAVKLRSSRLGSVSSVRFFEALKTLAEWASLILDRSSQGIPSVPRDHGGKSVQLARPPSDPRGSLVCKSLWCLWLSLLSSGSSPNLNETMTRLVTCRGILKSQLGGLGKRSGRERRPTADSSPKSKSHRARQGPAILVANGGGVVRFPADRNALESNGQPGAWGKRDRIDFLDSTRRTPTLGPLESVVAGC